MEAFLVFLVIAFVMVIVTCWIVVAIIGFCVRALLWGVKAPFKLGAATRSTFQPPPNLLPRADAVRCGNRKCAALLPAEARFCSRCGMALRTATVRDCRPRPVVATLVGSQSRVRVA